MRSRRSLMAVRKDTAAGRLRRRIARMATHPSREAGHHHPHHHPAHGHPTRRGFLKVLIPGSILATRAVAQQAGDQAERFRQMSEDFERTGLAEPFKGITANGELAPGLFPIRSTGVSTGPCARPRSAFLAALTAGAARRRPLFPIDDARVAEVDEPAFLRAQGVSFQEMTRGAARRRLRPAARRAERQGTAAHARHHAAQPHARRAEHDNDFGSTASGSTTSP